MQELVKKLQLASGFWQEQTNVIAITPKREKQTITCYHLFSICHFKEIAALRSQ
jgi:hypothetical protein